MANCCITQYAVTGPRESLTRLKEDLLKTKDPHHPENRAPWIGYFLKEIGLDPSGVLDRCGWIQQFSISLSEDGTRLDFDVESKWARCECLETILPEHYHGISVWFLEEELGCDIFSTNDGEHIYFPEYVIVDSDEDGCEYFTPEAAVEKILSILEVRGLKPGNAEAMPLEALAAFIFENLDDVWVHIAQV